jgi:oxygen-independent coproporphyrinogen-3 oxidase
MELLGLSPELLDRYDRPAPRYTSYPPIPCWSPQFGEAEYRAALADLAARPDDPVSIYVHLPFCVSRCFYCGCNATVTRHEGVRQRYVDRLIREAGMVSDALGGRRRAVEMHWGGGTPNYLAAPEMERLAEELDRRFALSPGAAMAIEVDPRVATVEQLGRLRGLGFNRLSIGVQDFDPTVQRAIGRMQSQAMVLELREAAEALGFRSVNFDLVYGLPGQSEASFRTTLDAVVAVGPDRIACFGYAHVPWARPNQRLIDERMLPDREDRFALFQLAVSTLLDAGYRWIGLDHFARPDDELALALDEGRLRRNFMGYVVDPAPHLLAFGTSGIGEVAGRYAQNDAHLGGYQRSVDGGALPITRGHLLSADDRLRRAAIDRLLCTLELPYRDLPDLGEAGNPLAPFRAFSDDGLVDFDRDRLTVTPTGRFFLRNLALALDAYADDGGAQRFSRTV